MARKVFLSFLGVNKYEPCRYKLGDNLPQDSDSAKKEVVRFVQEALIKELCLEWDNEDKICILLTKQAFEKNWKDQGHDYRKNKDYEEYREIFEQGLETRLNKLGLGATVEKVMIPEGRSEDEIWDIFEIIYEALDGEDQVYYDITHSFRSLPILAIIVIMYARSMKRISIEKILYGAYEAIEAPYDKKYHERIAPVFDMTPLEQLAEWTFAIEQFLTTGNAKAIKLLTEAELLPLLRHEEGFRKVGSQLKKIVSSLTALCDRISTSRAPMIPETASSLRELLEFREASGITSSAEVMPRPLLPLIERLKQKVAPFCGDIVLDGLNAVKWCIDHNLVQQGFTILLETMVTYILQCCGFDYRKNEYRNLVTSAVIIIKKNIICNEDEWHEQVRKHAGKMRDIIHWFNSHNEMRHVLERLIQARNDINHAGYKGNAITQPEKFMKKLRADYETIKDLVYASKARPVKEVP